MTATAPPPVSVERRSIWVARRDESLRPDLLPSLLPLLAAFALLFVAALGPFARGVEARAEEAARLALAGAGETWVAVRASGQWLELSGAPPSVAAAERAVEAVRRARAPTWLGAAAPATRVVARFGESAAAAATAAADEHLAGGPDAPAASAQPDGVRPASLAAAAEPARAPAATAATPCAALLREAAAARIGFAEASAALDARAAAVLDALAGAARGCDATIRVIGHTDDTGSAAANAALSLARAEAVRAALLARGVQGAQIAAEGAGETRPIADNATAEGRSRNRRIEFAVAASP